MIWDMDIIWYGHGNIAKKFKKIGLIIELLVSTI